MQNERSACRSLTVFVSGWRTLGRVFMIFLSHLLVCISWWEYVTFMQSEIVKTRCTQWHKGYKFIRTYSAVAMGTNSLGSNPQSTIYESKGIPSCLCLWSPHSGMLPCFQKKLAPPSLWEGVCPHPLLLGAPSILPLLCSTIQEFHWQALNLRKSFWSMLRMECLHLPTKKTPICWSTKPQQDGIWSWGLWEMIRFRWGHEGSALRMRLMPL